MKSHILKLSNNSSISFCNASKRFMATTHISNAVPPLNANEPCKFSPMNVPVGNFDEFLPPPTTTYRETKLSNGISIISTDKGGICSSLGVATRVSPLNEGSASIGMSFLMNRLAFRTTDVHTLAEQQSIIESKAASVQMDVSRSGTILYADVIRSEYHHIIPLMLNSLTRLRPTEEEFELARAEMMDRLEFYPNVGVLRLADALHASAFSPSCGLSRPSIPTESQLLNLKIEDAVNFTYQVADPSRLVICAVNVDHDTLADCIQKWFDVEGGSETFERAAAKRKELNILNDSLSLENPYKGGDVRYSRPNETMGHAALAFKTKGWNDPSAVPLSVLSVLIGSGGAFTTGGPGKGIHSRMMREVLSVIPIETASTTLDSYDNAGLFSLSATVEADLMRPTVDLLFGQLVKASKVTAAELSRAKLLLKTSVAANVEQRAIVVEDMCKQFITGGKFVPVDVWIDKISAVTQNEIKDAVEWGTFGGELSTAFIYPENLPSEYLPYNHSDIQNAFNKASGRFSRNGFSSLLRR